MKIIIFIPNDHIYANFVAKELINKFKKEIILIVKSDVLIPDFSFLKSIIKYLSTSGFYYFFNQSFKQIFFKVSKFFFKDELKIFYPYSKITKKYQIPIFKENNVNQKKFIYLIKSRDPDIIISIYFRQIFGKEILTIPHKGCINIHPAPLPKYRGVSPVFWALVNGEKNCGISVHLLDKKIDGGKIISQKFIPIKNNDTEHFLFLKCSQIGAQMLCEIIEKMKTAPLKGYEQKGEISYFSLPTREAVRKFRSKKRKFFRIREFLSGKATLSNSLQN